MTEKHLMVMVNRIPDAGEDHMRRKNICSTLRPSRPDRPNEPKRPYLLLIADC